MTAHLSTSRFTKYSQPLLRPTAQKKKKKSSFKLLLLIDNVPGHQRALIEIYNEMTVVFMPANISAACGSRGINFEGQEFQC